MIELVAQNQTLKQKLEQEFTSLANTGLVKMPDTQETEACIDQYCAIFDTLFPNLPQNTVDNIKASLKTISDFDRAILANEYKFEGEEVSLEYIRKWVDHPELILELKTANCSGVAAMFTAKLLRNGFDAKLCNPYGHAATILKLENQYHYVDARNNILRELQPKLFLTNNDGSFSLILPEFPIGHYTFIPVYNNFKQGMATLDYDNYISIIEDMQKLSNPNPKKPNRIFELRAARFVFNYMKGKSSSNTKISMLQERQQGNDCKGAITFYKKSSIWKSEAKNLSRQIEGALRVLGNSIDQHGLNISDLTGQGHQYMVSFLTEPEFNINSFSEDINWRVVRQQFLSQIQSALNQNRLEAISQIERIIAKLLTS
jgi:hypothetical protein